MRDRPTPVGALIGGVCAVLAAAALVPVRGWPGTTILLGLLGVAGVVMGRLALGWRRSRWQVRLRDYGLQRVHRVAELVVEGAGVDEVLDAVQDELIGELRLRDVGLIRGDVPSIHPVMEHNGIVEGERWDRAIWWDRAAARGEALPAEGVELPLVASGRTVGRLVLQPMPDVPVSHDSHPPEARIRVLAPALLITEPGMGYRFEP